MAEQSERPRPHGDPLEQGTADNPETNLAQRDSDAPPDATGEADGRGSDANGIPAFDDADGERRKKGYDKGADLVSRID
jgi:hypothetical protein